MGGRWHTRGYLSYGPRLPNWRGTTEMRSEVMPTVMYQLGVGESGHHFSGQYKTKDIRALVNKIAELEVHLGIATAMFDPENQPPQWSPKAVSYTHLRAHE